MIGENVDARGGQKVDGWQHGIEPFACQALACSGNGGGNRKLGGGLAVRVLAQPVQDPASKVSYVRKTRPTIIHVVLSLPVGLISAVKVSGHDRALLDVLKEEAAKIAKAGERAYNIRTMGQVSRSMTYIISDI